MKKMSVASWKLSQKIILDPGHLLYQQNTVSFTNKHHQKTTTEDAQLYLRAGIYVVNKFHHSLLSLHWAYSCVCCNVLQKKQIIAFQCQKYFCSFLVLMGLLKEAVQQCVLNIT